MKNSEKIIKIYKILYKIYNNKIITLNYNNDLELLISIILSAQTTDKQVNKVTENLFKKYQNLNDYIEVNIKELEEDIKSIGLYKTKAKNIKNTCQKLKVEFNSKIPDNIKDLIKLNGVGRKTANVFLNKAYNINEGIAIDTHMIRINNRLGFVKTKNPIIIEKYLKDILLKKYWGNYTNLIIGLGRDKCIKIPKCEECPIKKLCNYYKNNNL
ncbi:endonuclease III [Patescibacteria group bacterium]|nr:endonuclease III [Patescibacteria group bacterium]